MSAEQQETDVIDQVLEAFEPTPIQAHVISHGKYVDRSESCKGLLDTFRMFKLADYPYINIVIRKADIEKFRDPLFDMEKK